MSALKTSSDPVMAHDRIRHLRTVFLDRDGVLNEKMPEGQYVTSPEEFHLLPGVAEAIGRLNCAGLRVILVSNQRGIALGLYTAADVDAIHAGLQTVLENHGAQLDGIYYCPHDKSQCNCRKPMPGLFAAGELVGGLFYHNYAGGSGLVSGSVFGKLAGTGASAFAKS